MVPIQLKFQGIYSYQEPQIIDFTDLTAAGLFGIFGAVGSGKSSILEAISYALYGETERLNARDKRTYNMMNLKSNLSKIEFIFENHENKKYKATREFKRNSKNFEDVKTPTAGLYEWKNDDWYPLESTNVEPIIGLSYENFKRTIIIPQGQFKEFLELGEKDRTQMMKEIFNLHQFDLQDKVAVLAKQNLLTLSELKGQLIGFESISEEMIQEQKDNLIQLQENYSQQEILFKNTSAHFQVLKNIKSEFEILQQKKLDWEKISAEKQEIDQLDEQTKTYEKTYHVFHHLLQQLAQNQQDLQLKKKEIFEQTEIFSKTQKDFQDVKLKIQEIQPKYEQLDESKRQIQDLQILLEIFQKTQEVNELKARTEKGLVIVKDLETTNENFQVQLKELDFQMEEISKNLIDETILMQINDWFQQQKSFKNDHIRIQQSQKEIQESISKIDSELIEKGIQPEIFYREFEEALNTFETKKREIENQRNHLILQEKLSEYSENLKDGEPCPLCGALDHPNIAQIDNVSEEMNHLENEMKNLEEFHENWIKSREKLEQSQTKKQLLLENLARIEEELKLVNIQLDSHLQKFIWKEFQADQFEKFEQFRMQQIERNKLIKELQNQQKELRTKSEENRLNLDKYKTTLENFKREESNKESEINVLIKNINKLIYNELKNSTKEEIEIKLVSLQKEVSSIESLFSQLQQQFQLLSPQLASQETLLQSLEKRSQEIETNLANIESELSQKIQHFGLDSLDNVQQILAQKLDVESIKLRIQTYLLNRETLKNSIQELETKLEGKILNEEEFEAEQHKLQETEKAFKLATEEVAKQSAEIERLEKEYQQKSALLQQLSALEKREENLKTMTNLFKGAGFVQYVSSIYLRQLCDNANVRFHRMTRNQLSLQLSDKGDFEIIDYLNEGRSRSVKTLSGGQAFQASLSLALALAESVQSQAKSEKNFFFIDEGFGTQDSESVNIVFETLTSLQKENRIVGIISHVEELKERIPKALTIYKDEERGSLIERN